MDQDLALYQRFLSGERQALETLVALHTDNLIRFAYLYLKDSSAAEDGYVGFYNGTEREYVLLQYDGYSLREVFREPFFSHVGKTRACMVDGWAYLLGTCGLKAVQVY